MHEPGDDVRRIFLEALEKPEGPERNAYLAETCRDDQCLRKRVLVLLNVHAHAGDFLETPPLDAIEITSPPEGALIEKPGDKIGHYKLLQEIGEGGCGVVYMAEQEQPIRRRVALKVIKLGMDTKRVISRFEAERQALALMDHPNIARVLDAGTTATGRPYFVMELVRGTRITDYCDANQLSTEARLQLFIQVCQAIQHAHQKGIIHRDIKPSNILVTQLDGQPVPKVIDFGIAKATGGEVLTDKTLFTAFEQFIGTPAYMSPEQAELSGNDIDTRTDIYGLGVLLYELLTGRTPFEQKELVAAGLDAMRKIIREREPPRPSTRMMQQSAQRKSQIPNFKSQIPSDLDWIVMKCLEKSPSRRYETASGLADDVVRHLHDEAITARPQGRVYRFQKLVRRNKLVFGAGAAVVAALLVGLGLSTWLLFREQQARQRAIAAEQVQTELRQQAQAEAKKSEQVAVFLKDMLQGVGPSVARGRDTTMLKEILDRTAERVGKDLKDQSETEAELLSTLGDVYRELGQYTNSAAMHRRALDLRRALYGNMHTNVANSLADLGLALLRPDTLGEAESCFQETLMIRTNLLGPDNVEVADSLRLLGRVRFFQGRASEGELFCRRSLEMYRRFVGNDDRQVARALGALYYCLREQNRLAEAEQAARDAVDIYSRLNGTAPALEEVGARGHVVEALLQQGRMSEAEQPARETLMSSRKLLGAEHSVTIEITVTVSDILVGLGKLEEALILAQANLAQSKKVFGRRFPTPYCVSSVGVVFYSSGKRAEAEQQFREALVLYEQSPNIFPSNERAVRGLVVQLLREQQKWRELEKFFAENLAAQRKIDNVEARHREVDLLRHWASLRKDQGKLDEAEAMYRQALQVIQTLPDYYPDPGIGLPDTWLGSYLDLAGVLKQEGKLGEAEAVSRSAVDLARKRTNPHDVANSLAILADTLRLQGKAPEAEPLYREVLDIRREAVANAAKTEATNSADWESQLNNLAGTMIGLGKADEAIHWLELAPTNGLYFLRLACALAFTGNTEGYRRICREALVRLGTSDDLSDREKLAKICLLLPDSGVDFTVISNCAWVAAGPTSPVWLRPWAESTLRRVHYRLGNYAQAIDRDLEFEVSADYPARDVETYCILAMAHQKLDHPPEARDRLAKALQINETKLPARGSDLGPEWHDCLIAQMLLREAKELIGDVTPHPQTNSVTP